MISSPVGVRNRPYQTPLTMQDGADGIKRYPLHLEGFQHPGWNGVWAFHTIFEGRNVYRREDWFLHHRPDRGWVIDDSLTAQGPVFACSADQSVIEGLWNTQGPWR